MTASPKSQHTEIPCSHWQVYAGGLQGAEQTKGPNTAVKGPAAPLSSVFVWGSIRLPGALLVILIGLELRCIPNVQVGEQEKTDREDSDVKGDLETPEMAPSASQSC